jgi:hypothetical protein
MAEAAPQSSADCPFEKAGHEYSAVDRAQNEIELARRSLREDSNEYLRLRRVENEIVDRLRAIDETISFSTPKSLVGIMVGVIVLSGIADDLCQLEPDEPEYGRQRRRYARVTSAMLELLEQSTGVPASELGADWRRMPDEWPEARRRLGVTG